MVTSTIAANAIKGCTTMLSLSSLRRTRGHGFFSSLVTRSSFIVESKCPIFSISVPVPSSSPSRERRRIAPCFSLFCTDSTDTAVTESVATTSSDASGNSEINVKDAVGLLDIRVGQILRAWKHEEADSLYVEEVDIGEPEPRIICSGLVKYIPLDHLQGQKVIVLSNLKPRTMRGVKSSGMLMAASDAKHENVELLCPPDEAVPGERIWFGSEDEKENQPAPATPNQIQKKKTWESVQPHLKTDASCIAMLGEHVMRTSAGAVACQSLQNANVS